MGATIIGFSIFGFQSLVQNWFAVIGISAVVSLLSARIFLWRVFNQAVLLQRYITLVILIMVPNLIFLSVVGLGFNFYEVIPGTIIDVLIVYIWNGVIVPKYKN